jgi:hypothetical protein
MFGDFTEAASAIMKRFPKAVNRHLNWYRKTTEIDSFADF